MPVDVALRSKGIGASEIACVVGLHPTRSAFDLWLAKTGQVEQEDFASNPRVRWGRLLEQAIAQGYAIETNREIEWFDKTILGRHPYQVLTPDAFVVHEPIGVDCKNVAWDQAGKFGEPGTAEVPDRIALQCHWSLSALPERERWDVAALFGGHNLKVYIVVRDEEVEAMLVEAGERFWVDHVLNGKAPEITATDSTLEWLKKRFPDNDGALRTPTLEEEDLLNCYRLADEEFDIAEKNKKDLEARLKFAIAESEGFIWSGGTVTFKKVRGGPRSYVVPDHRRLHKNFK